MTDPILMLPIAAIDASAMIRDRTGFDPEPFDELKRSILVNGLRMPIEVFALDAARGAMTHGLISGARRLAAFQALAEMTEQDRWNTIPAFVRAPQDVGARLEAMIEENEIRAEISPYERGRIACIAFQHGLFPTIEEAVDKLYPRASQPKRSRLRALARLCEVVDGLLSTPERLTLAQALRLANAVRDGYGELMVTALEQSRDRAFAAQWEVLTSVLREAEEFGLAEPDPVRPGRPRRILDIRKGLVVRRERIREGWILRFTGPNAKTTMLDDLLDEIEKRYSGW
jgi:ParB family chromosome partitioning protein